MKEELTTLMHAEFFDDPQEKLEILVMGAVGAMLKGEDKNKVLSDLGISEEQFRKTAPIVFPSGFAKDLYTT